MKTIEIPITERKYDGEVLATNHVLALRGTYKRFGIGAVPRGKEGRRVSHGALVPGPWAFTFGLATVLAANPAMSTGAERQRNIAAGIEHEVEAGDQIRFDDVTYLVTITDGFGKTFGPLEFITLVPVEG